MRERILLEEITHRYQRILGQNFLGLYVHGSIAFGCFSWEKSDIDFLVVVATPLSLSEKEKLISAMLELDLIGPPKGFEMSVVLLKTCRSFHYPTPYELHYSNAHKAKYLADITEHCRLSYGTDPDLAAHFTVTRAVGFPIYGPPVEEIFSPVPKDIYWASLLSDVQNVETEIMTDPLYYVLNLCRMLAYQQEGLILSKEQGGQWALSHLPLSYQPTVAEALVCYQKGFPFTPEHHQATAFAQAMTEKFSTHGS